MPGDPKPRYQDVPTEPPPDHLRWARFRSQHRSNYLQAYTRYWVGSPEITLQATLCKLFDQTPSNSGRSSDWQHC
ncbi:hypothetical protein H920_09257 [Fukomys damarensis]|uniref:Uncharacterized protein n=1 Tax=Fukomys damarensis TaxID=885580 RepID=A0A091DGC2_FUKDA|nr:hypothetical protein H920_09257 [Fukomys damarensis]